MAEGPILMSPSGRGQPLYSENMNRYSNIANRTNRASVNHAILLRRLTTRSHSAICSRVHTSSRSLLLILWGLRLGALQAKQRTRDCSVLEPHLLQIHIALQTVNSEVGTKRDGIQGLTSQVNYSNNQVCEETKSSHH